MITIENIYSYIRHHLQMGSPLDANDVLLRLYNSSDYIPYIGEGRYNKYNYKRILIESCDILDVYIIVWKPGAKSPIHDHPNQGCLMKVLHGELEEKQYHNQNNSISYKTLKEKCIEFIQGGEPLHRIQNNSKHYAISLHVYSPGKYNTKIYEERRRSCMEEQCLKPHSI